MNQTRFTSTWDGETRQLSDLLARLSFRDAAGAEIPVGDAFHQWCDHAVRIRESRRVCYLIGNGACATLASHFSADLAKNGRIHTQVFSDPALLTAISNDCGYEQVFAEPLNHMGVPGDLLVVISS